MSETPVPRTPNEPIIDHIPTAAELGDQDTFVGPYTAEYVPPHLTGMTQLPGESTEPDAIGQVMVQNLGKELQFGSDEYRGDLVKGAFGVARHLADIYINKQSHEAFNVIDRHRRLMRQSTTFVDGAVQIGADQVGETAGYVATRPNGRREMGIDVDRNLQGTATYESFARKLTEAGLEINSADLSTLLLLRAVGHEAGHIAQHAIALDVANMQDYSVKQEIHNDMAFGAYLLTKGVVPTTTGNLETDALIYSEQFAEGYGMVVVSEAAKKLGYSEETVSGLLNVLKISEQELGHHHLLDEVSADKSLDDVFREKSLDGNSGEFGYTKPRTPQEVVNDLIAVTDLYEGGRVSLTQAAYSKTIVEMPPQLLTLTEAVPPVAEGISGKQSKKRVVRRILAKVGMKAT